MITKPIFGRYYGDKQLTKILSTNTGFLLANDWLLDSLALQQRSTIYQRTTAYSAVRILSANTWPALRNNC